jgi:hypothetical protein
VNSARSWAERADLSLQADSAVRCLPAILLLLASTRVAAAQPGDARALHGQARAEAMRGRCASAHSLAEILRAEHAAYYQERVARDPVVARCADAIAAPLAPAHHRVGVDAGVVMGAVVAAGAGLRYEHPLDEQTAVVGRAMGITGAVYMAEDDGFDALLALVGARQYTRTGRIYLLAEGGLAAVRTRAHVGPFDDFVTPASWTTVPTVQFGLGCKLGRFDAGLSGSIPFFGVAVQLGVDLGSF